MADFKTITDGIKEEIYQRIARLAPQGYPGEKWDFFEDSDSQASELMDATGNPRIVGMADWLPALFSAGSIVRKYELTASVKIGYPRGDEWRRTAIADFDDIARDLNTNSTSVEGCDFREIRSSDGPTIPTFEDASEGDWQWMTIPMYSVIETSGPGLQPGSRGYETIYLKPNIGPVSWTTTFTDDFISQTLFLKFSAAPSSAGDVVVWLDSEQGATYDTILRSKSAVGASVIDFESLPGIKAGDALRVVYANPDNVTIRGICTADLDFW